MKYIKGKYRRKMAIFMIFVMLVSILPTGLLKSGVAHATSPFVFDIPTKTITGYTSLGGAVVIPRFIDGHEVHHIAINTFRDKALSSVTFEEPSNLKTIGPHSFANNVGGSNPSTYTSIVIPEGVTSIENGAFNRNNLNSISLPNSLINIGDFTFMNNNLTSLTIPNNVTSIGMTAFGGNNLTSLTLPNTALTIGDAAFSPNNLTSVTIPSNVISLGVCALLENYNLTSVTFEGSGLTIGDSLVANSGVNQNNLREQYLLDGAGTYTGTHGGPWTKTITIADNLAEAKASIETALNILSVTNETIEADILDAANNATTHPITVAWVATNPFNKTNATSDATGLITGRLLVSLNGLTTEVELNKTIPILPPETHILVSNRTQLIDAINGAPGGDIITTIKLDADIEMFNHEFVKIDSKKIIIDLCGHTISNAVTSLNPLISLQGTATLEVKDTSGSQDGKINSLGTGTTTPAVSVVDFSTLTISSGIISGNLGPAVSNSNLVATSSIIINGGTLRSYGSVVVQGYFGKVTINDGNLISLKAEGYGTLIDSHHGNTTILGGTFDKTNNNRTLHNLSSTGVTIGGGDLGEVAIGSLKLLGNPKFTLILTASLFEKFSIVGPLTGNSGDIILDLTYVAPANKVEGSIIATTVNESYIDLTKFSVIGLEGLTIVKDGANIKLATAVAVPTDLEKLAEARTNIESAINGLQLTNTTTAEDILNAATAATLLGVAVAWDGENGFNKTNATSTTAGSITGTLTLNLSDSVDSITITKTIPQLLPWSHGITGLATDTWDNGGTITTAEQLAQFAYNVNNGKNYSGQTITLGNDIDLSDREWTPIGNSDINSFRGTFDGNGHKITGLQIGLEADKNSDLIFIGLFGVVTNGGTIKNLGVDAAIYSNRDGAGAIDILTGGLVGKVDWGIISNCYSTGIIERTGTRSWTGGLVGHIKNNNSMVTNSYSTATVNNLSQTYNRTGGLIGFSDGTSIFNSYATGNVQGGTLDYSNFTGGLAGHIQNATIRNCFATGDVRGASGGNSNFVGGFVGVTHATSISLSYRNSDANLMLGASPQNPKLGIGNDSGTSNNVLIEMTSADMKNEAFVETLNNNLYTLANPALYKWQVKTNDYPTFSNTLWAVPTTIAKEFIIGTTAPAWNAFIADGTNTPPTGAIEPVVTWSINGGASYYPANGTFKAGTIYKTKYVYTVSEGHLFDNTITENDITVTNLGSGTKTFEIAADKKTLTITVTWAPTVIIDLPDGVFIKQIATGNHHSLALTSEGVIYAWGNGVRGQLGDGRSGAGYQRTTPVKVSDNGDFINFGIEAIAAGDIHSLAILNGVVYAWGGPGFNGVLGNGSTNDSSIPVKVANNGDFTNSYVTAIAAGRDFSLALREGVVYGWGNNYNQQLGFLDNMVQLKPVKVSDNTNIVNDAPVFVNSNVAAIAAGVNHSLALKDGVVYAWGNRTTGRLGDNTNFAEDQNVWSYLPIKVHNNPGVFTNTSNSAIAAGLAHSMVLTESGELYAWGANYSGQLGNGLTTNSGLPIKVSGGQLPNDVSISAIATGYHHSLVMTSTGDMYAWGHGMLGNGTNVNSSQAVKVAQGAIPTESHIIEISANESFSLALTNTGEVYSWGDNYAGKLGHGDNINKLTPVAVVPYSEWDKKTINILAILGVTVPATGATPVALITETDQYTGTITWSPADNTFQTGTTYTATITLTAKDGFTLDGVTENFFTVAGATSVTNAINISGVNSGVVRAVFPVTSANPNIVAVNNAKTAAEGAVYSNMTQAAATSETDIENAIKAAAEAAISNSAITVEVDTISYTPPIAGTAEAINGTNGSYTFTITVSKDGVTETTTQISITITATAFMQNILPDGVFVKQIVAGTGFSLALTSEGVIYSWGSGEYGKLGNGGTESQSTPVRVADGEMGNSGVTAIAAGRDHALALKGGEVYAWGRGFRGILGNGGRDDQSRPVKVLDGVMGNSGVTAIAAGADFSLALKGEGAEAAVYAWGWESEGRLGNGVTAYNIQDRPVRVSDNTGIFTNTSISAIAAGDRSSYVIQNGVVFSWGSDYSGQLGTGVIGNQNKPVKVANGAMTNSGVTAIAAGNEHVLALKNGMVFSWGSGNSGRLGGTGVSYQRTPFRVVNNVGIFTNSNVTAIAAGAAHSLALKGEEVYAWGGGLLGDEGGATQTIPIKISDGIMGNSGVTAIAAGNGHTLALKDGVVYAWGNNSFGQLGNGGTTNQLTPVKVSPLPVGDIVVKIDIFEISGITPPVTGATRVTTITETAQYTGTVTWSPNHATFQAGTTYTATITLTPKTGFTLQGVTANFFTVAGTSQAATNNANLGVITAIFPATSFPAPTVPVITTQPSNQTTFAGGTATFSVTANTTTGALNYQWQTRANDSGTWVNVATGTGINGRQYTTPILSAADNNRQYRVVIKSKSGDVFSAEIESAGASIQVSNNVYTISSPLLTIRDQIFDGVDKQRTIPLQATGSIVKMNNNNHDTAVNYSYVVITAIDNVASISGNDLLLNMANTNSSDVNIRVRVTATAQTPDGPITAQTVVDFKAVTLVSLASLTRPNLTIQDRTMAANLETLNITLPASGASVIGATPTGAIQYSYTVETGAPIAQISNVNELTITPPVPGTYTISIKTTATAPTTAGTLTSTRITSFNVTKAAPAPIANPTCTIDITSFTEQTLTIPAGDNTITTTLTESAIISEGTCNVNDIVYTYKIKPGTNTAGASIVGDQVTATRKGQVTVIVTASITNGNLQTREATFVINSEDIDLVEGKIDSLPNPSGASDQEITDNENDINNANDDFTKLPDNKQEQVDEDKREKLDELVERLGRIKSMVESSRAVDAGSNNKLTSVDVMGLATAIKLEDVKADIDAGKEIIVKLEIEDEDNSSNKVETDRDKAIINQEIATTTGRDVSRAFNINITKIIEQKQGDQVTTRETQIIKETVAPIFITIGIPTNMRNGSNYEIIHVHTKADGTKEISTIIPEHNQSNHTLRFTMSKFSTIAIVYTPPVVPPGPGPDPDPDPDPAPSPGGDDSLPTPTQPEQPVQPEQPGTEQPTEDNYWIETPVKDGEQVLTQVEIDEDKIKEILDKDPDKKDIIITIKPTPDNGTTSDGETIADGETTPNDGTTPDGGTTTGIGITSEGTVVIIPANVTEQINNRNGTISIETDDIEWTMTGEQLKKIIDNSTLKGQSESNEIDIVITAKRTDTDKASRIEQFASNNNITIVSSLYDFKIQITAGQNKDTATTLQGYAKIRIPVPLGLENYTTAVRFDEAGNMYHVPTNFKTINGRLYAEINSATAGTYAIIHTTSIFIDVNNHWSEQTVNKLASKQIIFGVGDNNFEPERNITRAEFITLLVRSLGLLGTLDIATAEFSDVTNDKWYYEAIQIARAQGFVNGYGNNEFKPQETISRQEAMIMIARAARFADLADKSQGTSILNNYSDQSDVAPWAKDDVASVVGLQILNGFGNGDLKPKASISRAQSAQAISNLLTISQLINR